ncbi:autotransporter outer membrane beta-barrel domain-containing protein [Cloacibacillus porcorum]|uniref:autotransporter outer membrane beta-barrel domain-containing protein n=1 Tax=Cloacibacillus porcorum TaxID=1197717 RepID=UPI00145970FE|nr:autotransporter outer membrane beta-barrel domain-containing protein [Cloacibacillus porcorum]MCC8185530.1 autotransporter outer membrane beta-barrel domain-containing protein [Cloacibacillus porcorum]MDY5389355.1 autotransporter outer membrane beta-barrel domain-containing protein [Cloacibacillus porcorum]NMF19029.1 autotransporter outer membrane beta-barrel domain-containing protein [Cloacibacillus porcorum]
MKRMRVICATVIIALCVHLTPASAEKIYTDPVTDSHEWNEDVTITTNAIVNEDSREGGGIYFCTNGPDQTFIIVEADNLVKIRANLGEGNEQGDKLYGIRTSGAHNAVFLLGKADIEAGYMTLSAENATSIIVGDYSSLITTSSHFGVHSSDDSNIHIGDNVLIQAGDKTKFTSNGYTVWAKCDGGIFDTTIEIGDHAQISNAGNYTKDGAAVYAQGGGIITIGDDSEITSIGERDPTVKINRHNIGVRADGWHWRTTYVPHSLPLSYAEPELVLAPSKVVLGDRISIYTDGREGNMGIYASDRAEVIAGEDLTINTHGSEGSNFGVFADEGAQVTIKSACIETEGKDSHGLIAWRQNDGQNSKITITDGSHIKAMGANAYGVAAIDGGEVELTGKHTIETDLDNGSHALWTKDGGVITADGQMSILGGLYAEDSGKINMTMQDGSYMKGFSSIDGGQSGEIHVEMKNAYWDLYKQDSELNSLKMATNATIDYTKENSHINLYAHDISGSGTFVMKTDVVGGNGDLLTVDTSDGDHKIKVMDRGSAPTTGDEAPLKLVKTGDGKAEFTLTGKDNLVDIGAWQYGLRRALENNNHWELFTTKTSSPAASAAVNTFMGGYLLAYAETQTLMQRLGDLRDTDHDNGYWFRFHGGRMESNSRSFVRDFDMKYGGAQVGYDRKIKNDWKGDTYVGGYFGYSKGNLDYSILDGGTGGSGSVDSRTLGLYGTYIADDGFYVDAVLKYMWMKNDFDVLDSDGGHVTGDGLSTGGVGLSLELGKRFRFTKNEKGENWYIEPQAQLSYTHQNGGYFNASNGLRIGVDSFNSLLGRLGMLAGYETAKTNVYVKVSYVKEFDGDVNIIANNVSIPESFGDSWWEYGLGFTTKLNDRNSIYMSLERSSGGKFTEPWKVYAGWRITI